MHPMVLSNYIAKIDRTVEALRRHNMDAHRVNDRDEIKTKERIQNHVNEC